MSELLPPNTRDGQHLALIYEQLRRAILIGELEPGDAISQATLARDFNAGRTPLREALRMLQREGLVVSEPNRKVQIAPLSIEDAAGLYVMRLGLEAIAVRLTVPRLSSSDVAELEGFMAQMEHFQRRDDRPGLRSPHRAFHLKLVGGAEPRVVATIGQLFDHAERYRLAFGGATPELWEMRRTEHRAILDAAAAGETDLAVHHLARHYARTAVKVFEALDPAYEPESLLVVLDVVAPGVSETLAPA
jgi:DNA-binding GntR family transcriptional regulator